MNPDQFAHAANSLREELANLCVNQPGPIVLAALAALTEGVIRESPHPLSTRRAFHDLLRSLKRKPKNVRARGPTITAAVERDC